MDGEQAFVNVSPAVTAVLNNCLLGYACLDGVERLLKAVEPIFRTATSQEKSVQMVTEPGVTSCVWLCETQTRLCH